MTTQQLVNLAQTLGYRLRNQGWRLAIAESCTGGWVAKTITAVPGSSGWFELGLVTYSNESKQNLLGVTSELLSIHGAVSQATVTQMALGALQCSCANVAIAVSGVAGPDGGSLIKPVGTVWLAWVIPGIVTPKTYASCKHFLGDREAVRYQTVVQAIAGLIEIIPV